MEGISISGGEPLEQPYPLLALLRLVKLETNLSVVVFTGFALEEIENSPDMAGILPLVDVLIAGPYQCEARMGAGLLGSANQRIHLLTERYRMSDILSVPEAEVIVMPGGHIYVSGIAGDDIARILAQPPGISDRQ